MGEIQLFSHLYQFVEQNTETPMVILIQAYDIPTAKVFKGYLFGKSETYKNIELSEDEIQILKEYVGEFKNVGFNEFISNTALEDYHKNFEEIEVY